MLMTGSKTLNSENIFGKKNSDGEMSPGVYLGAMENDIIIKVLATEQSKR